MWHIGGRGGKKYTACAWHPSWIKWIRPAASHSTSVISSLIVPYVFQVVYFLHGFQIKILYYFLFKWGILRIYILHTVTWKKQRGRSSSKVGQGWRNSPLKHVAQNAWTYHCKHSTDERKHTNKQGCRVIILISLQLWHGQLGQCV
jgi:hypothetical protein